MEGTGGRGVYVDDERYGRVLVGWGAFERVEFRAGGSGPGYGDFSRGGAIVGVVTKRSGERVAGRLVFDLDESETTDTLDAPRRGVTYTIPFGLIASIGLEDDEAARVKLHTGEELELERAGDLGRGNAGVLIVVEGRARAEYVVWGEVVGLEFERMGRR